jgi:hypothetical protein
VSRIVAARGGFVNHGKCFTIKEPSRYLKVYLGRVIKEQFGYRVALGSGMCFSKTHIFETKKWINVFEKTWA